MANNDLGRRWWRAAQIPAEAEAGEEDSQPTFFRSFRAKKMKFEKFGDTEIPFADPAWYRGVPTPYYEEKHMRFAMKLRAFMDKEIIPFCDEWDEAGDAPYPELRRKAAAAGVLAPWAPKELGGTPPEGGWDDFMLLIWIDETTRVGCGGVVLVLFQIAYMSVPHTLHFGSNHLKETFARPVIEGRNGMCITLTEPAGGSDLANITTTAVRSADGRCDVQQLHSCHTTRVFCSCSVLQNFVTGVSTHLCIWMCRGQALHRERAEEIHHRRVDMRLLFHACPDRRQWGQRNVTPHDP